MPKAKRAGSGPRTVQHPFQIRITAEERAAWDEAAEDQPTSTWARETLNRVATLRKKGASSPIERASLPSRVDRWREATANIQTWLAERVRRDDVALLVVPILGDGVYFTVSRIDVQTDTITVDYQPENAVGTGSEGLYSLVFTPAALTGVSEHLITFETDGDLGALVFGPVEPTRINAYNLAH